MAQSGDSKVTSTAAGLQSLGGLQGARAVGGGTVALGGQTANQFQIMLEKLGVVTCVTRTAKAVKMVEAQMAKQADRAMIGQVRLMLNKFGFKIKESIHSAGEPALLARFLDNVFGPFWKEVENSLLDSFILETGFQFKEYRKALGRHKAEAPTEPIEWCRATLLHAMEPCDLSLFGRIRNPLYAAIFMAFLFPLFGVDSIMVILYWVCQKKVDEFQLVNFIIKSKGLQFITGGLIGGALGFVKLFRCSTTADIHGPKGCEFKAPGVTKFFRFQFALLLVRSFLVFFTFILLFNFETIERWDKKAQAEAATSDPRRGLFKPTKTAGLMFINWILFTVNVGLTLRNIHDGRETGLGAFDTVAMNFCLVLVPLNYLLNVRQLRWYPAVIAGGMAVGSIGYVVVKYGLINKSGAGIILNQYSLILNALYALPLYVILALRQKWAMADDTKKLEELTNVITDLDSDGDGEVSKKELKNVFAKLFPGANFEATWEELDSDGSGSLTTKELANHFGMGHLVKGTKEEEEAAMKQFGGGSMADIEAQLEELSSSELSGTAGGVMTYFFWWDLGIFVVLTIYAVVHAGPHVQADGFGSWRLDATLYFCKMIQGLGAFPFLLFKLPLVRDALTHTRPTGYDRSGACIAMLPAGERKRRFREAYLADCVAQVERSKKGGKDLRSCDEKSTDAWNAMLGPSFTPKQTYQMINKKFGPAVAKSFKPKDEVDVLEGIKIGDSKVADGLVDKAATASIKVVAKAGDKTAANGTKKEML